MPPRYAAIHAADTPPYATPATFTPSRRAYFYATRGKIAAAREDAMLHATPADAA